MFKSQMIAENVKIVREKIRNACLAARRSPDSVTLIGVSKTFDDNSIAEAIHAGLLDIGENYVQEVSEKREKLSDDRIRWHFIGHLQSNKVKYIADWVHLIHSVDNERVASEIQKRAIKLGRSIDVLIEVNTSGESSKFGVKPEEADGLARQVSGFSGIRLRGLMTIGPFSDEMEQSRMAFRKLKAVFDEVNDAGFLKQKMEHLSMGMSHDFIAAIEEGSTMVRIGTAIFGSRQTANVN